MPGLSANIEGDGGHGHVSDLIRQGYVAMPHGFLPAVAFGLSRAGSQHSTYLDMHSGHDLAGNPVVKWTDAWTRPLRLGHIVEWEQDEEGRDAFLIAAWVKLCNADQPLSKLQVRIATRPLISRIESEANQSSERSRLLISQLAAQLPAEHYTESVRQILRRQDVEVPAAPSKK